MANYFTNLAEWAPLLLEGAAVTVLVSVLTMILGTALGLIIALLLVIPGKGHYRFVSILARIYVDVLRGLPIIVTLFIIYFGLPMIGLQISSNAIVAGTVGLTLALSAYLAEVFRAAIISIEPSQLEAAAATGMTIRQAYRLIIIPQATLIAVPTLGGYFIGLLKDTSLLGFISVNELMRTGISLVSQTFLPFDIYLTIGAIYLVMSLVASILVSRLERNLRPL
jgi:His/Glu/Gln/Arg/opine family amino acid ABC transporter permease subunit